VPYYYGLTENQKLAKMQLGREAEMKSLTTCLTWIQTVFGMSKLFPRLETIAISSVYGKLGVSWNEDKTRSLRKDNDLVPPAVCAKLFHEVLATSTVKHVCVGDSNGPLSLPRYPQLPLVKGKYTQTLHFGGGDTLPVNGSDPRAYDTLSLPLGQPVRWVSQYSSTEDAVNLLGYMIRVIQNVVDIRAGDYGQNPPREKAILLELYCSSRQLRAKDVQTPKASFTPPSPPPNRTMTCRRSLSGQRSG
jgi:hypothetical protein